MGARVGSGLNRILTLYLSAYEADVDVLELDAFDKVKFGHVDLGVRLHLANSRSRWVPYGDLAVTFWPVTTFSRTENGPPRFQREGDLQPGRRTRDLPV